MMDIKLPPVRGVQIGVTAIVVMERNAHTIPGLILLENVVELIAEPLQLASIGMGGGGNLRSGCIQDKLQT